MIFYHKYAKPHLFFDNVLMQILVIEIFSISYTSYLKPNFKIFRLFI